MPTCLGKFTIFLWEINLLLPRDADVTLLLQKYEESGIVQKKGQNQMSDVTESLL